MPHLATDFSSLCSERGFRHFHLLSLKLVLQRYLGVITALIQHCFEHMAFEHIAFEPIAEKSCSCYPS